MVGRLVLSTALVTGCFTAVVPECTVLCGEQDLCPEGLRCEADGFCHSPGTPSCRSLPTFDGGLDAGAVDAGPGLASLGAVCSQGWCRLHPPFTGSVTGFWESDTGERLVTAGEGLFLWTPQGWSLAYAQPETVSLTARRLSDLRVYTRDAAHRFRGVWEVERLPTVPVSTLQAGQETFMVGLDRRFYSAGVMGFTVDALAPMFSSGLLAANGTQVWVYDAFLRRLSLRSSPVTGWRSKSVVLNGATLSAVATAEGVLLFGQSGLVRVETNELLGPSSAPAVEQLSANAVIGARVGSSVLAVEAQGALLEVRPGLVAVVGAVPAELAASLRATATALRPQLRAFPGETGLWLSLNERLWNVGSDGGVEQFGAVTTAPVVGGFDVPDAGPVFVAGGTMFQQVQGLTRPLPGAPANVFAVARLGRAPVVAGADGLYLAADGGWARLLAHTGLQSLASNDTRLVSLTSDGGLLTFENGAVSTLVAPGRPSSVAVGADGRAWCAVGSRIFVEDGGVLVDTMTAGGGAVQALGRAPDGDVLFVRAPQVCSLGSGRCTQQLIVDTNAQFYADVGGALALRGVFGSLYLLRSLDDVTNVAIPVVPTAAWSAGGRLFLGADAGQVYAGP